MAEPETVTEYAIEMSGGGMQLRNEHQDIERIYPLTEWIEHNTRHGGRVWTRRVVVVEDWTEVTA